jgi:hypothetical protein
MTINEILEVEGLRCIEPSFADLADDIYTPAAIEMEAEEGRLLLDEEEYPLALALKGTEGWEVVSFIARPPNVSVIEKIEEVGGDVYQASRDDWTTALRRYYNEMIADEIHPPIEDTRPGRMEEIRDLLREIWPEPSDAVCLDCCSGSGVGSAALRDLGMRPLAYDNDAALLALGFATGRLDTASTMCIDATVASDYLDPASRGIGMMFGDITSFNADMWEQIVCELIALSDETVITVATEPEIRMIETWCRREGCEIEIFEHTRDPIYDRFVCVARWPDEQ